MKRRPVKVDRGAVSESIYHVRMTHAIERDGFVLKIGNERSLQLNIGRVLEIKVQSFNYDRARRALGGGVVVGNVDLGVTATAEAFEDVVPPIKSALLEFEF